MTLHEALIREAIKAAAQAAAKGNHPFGAVLARDGEIVLTAENEVNTMRDVTRHAELALVSEATRRFSADELADMTLYASTEPCAMCAGAMVWAGIRRLVYACGARKLAELTGSPFLLPSREVFEHVAFEIEVVGPVLEEEAFAQHRDFW